MTLFTTLCSGDFSVFSLHDFTKAFDNVDHFFLPKTLSFLYSITLLSLDSPLTYLIVLSNPPMILLFFCSQMLGIFKVLFFAFFLIFLTLSVQPNSCILFILPSVVFHYHSKIHISTKACFLSFLLIYPSVQKHDIPTYVFQHPPPICITFWLIPFIMVAYNLFLNQEPLEKCDESYAHSSENFCLEGSHIS